MADPELGDIWEGVDGEPGPVLVTGIAEGQTGASFDDDDTPAPDIAPSEPPTITFSRLNPDGSVLERRWAKLPAFASARLVARARKAPPEAPATEEQLEVVAKAVMMFDRARQDLAALELVAQPSAGLDYIRDAIGAASKGASALAGFRALQDYLGAR